MKQLFTLTVAICLLIACGSIIKSPGNEAANFDGGFNDYWYQGKAEITGYKRSK